MIQSIIDFFFSPLGIVTVLSFFSGVFGYIIVVFWIRPVMRYKRVRSEVGRYLQTVFSALDENGSVETDAQRCNQLASRLNDVWHGDLPPWYRIMLTGKNELPLEAAKGLMTLAKTTHPDHVRKRIQHIHAQLRLE